jgi:adenosyl cobinamide kinase/adenosyl cobinamide phosphate guanylyltransferase
MIAPFLQACRQTGTSSLIAEAAYHSENPVLVVVATSSAKDQMLKRISKMEAVLQPLEPGKVEITTIDKLNEREDADTRCVLFDTDAVSRLVM